MQEKCIISLLCFIFLFTSCHTDKSGTGVTPKLLPATPTRKISLPIDARTSPVPFKVQYYSGAEGPCLYVDNALGNGINCYDLRTTRLIDYLSFAKEGPKGVPGMQGFHVHRPDSIFISGEYRVYLALPELDSVRSFSVIPHDKNNVSKPIFSTQREVRLKGTTLEMVGIPYEDPMFDGFVNLALDISSGELSLEFPYPESFSKQAWSTAQGVGSFRTAMPDGKWLYSFANSDSLYVTDHQELLKAYPSKTMLSPSPVPMPSRGAASSRSGEEELLDNTVYWYVAYDRWREQYYRMVLHPIESRNPDTGQPNSFLQKPISVMVLNNNLEVLGEHRFPNNTHQYFSWFVSEDGLCISLEHPWNTVDGGEDSLDFQCYTFTSD